MPRPLITVVIPTVQGREALLTQCLAAYANRSVYPIEPLVYHDRPTCGIGWQLGAQEASGDYIHITADDLEPHEGWDVAAVNAIDDGYLPAPRVIDPAGQPQYLPGWGAEHPDGTEVDMSTIPFMSRTLLEKVTPLFTAHYWTDNFFSDRAKAAGYQPRLTIGYGFTHHWGQPGRGAGMGPDDRMAHDRRAYDEATALVAAGQWTRPWPHDAV